MSPPSWTSLPPPTPSHPSRSSQSPGLTSLHHTANPTGCSAHDHADVSMLLCPFVPPCPSPPRVYKSVPISFPLLSGVIPCGLVSSARSAWLIWVICRHTLFLSFKADSPPVLSLPSWRQQAFPSPWASCPCVAHPLGPCPRLPFSALPGKWESSAAACQWPCVPFVSLSLANRSLRKNLRALDKMCHWR